MKPTEKSKAEILAGGNPAAAELREELKRVRERVGLSQSQAAEAWEMQPRTLKAWENCQALPMAFFRRLVIAWLRREDGAAAEGKAWLERHK
jgi:DNA-binding transcriptional regulator YiaG